MENNPDPHNRIHWEPSVDDKFNQLIAKIPVFLRSIAQGKLLQRIESNLKKENRGAVSEKDLVDVFFAETPFGFHGPMKTDMQELGIDYTKYGYSK